MLMPLVSVIIPNYNHGKYLKERIESVLNQTCNDLELIILDDCSTDESSKIIEQYRLHPKISHIVYNEKNSGSPIRQWTKGIALAKGEWIWIAESDDYADLHFLGTLLPYSQEYPTAGILYSNSYKEVKEETSGFKTSADETNFDFNTDLWSRDHLMQGEEANALYLCKKNIILNVSSALIQKKYIAELPAKIMKMKYYGDWYCYIYLAGQADIFYCRELLNTFRRHPSSLINKSKPEKIKIDCFRILDLLVRQRNINQHETIHFFSNVYLGKELKRAGILSFIKTLMEYFLINPYLGLMVTAKIFQSKLKTKS
jgi:glycosyltransferase involved in cell wall biosynthesis